MRGARGQDEYELELKYTKEKADTEVQQERSGTAVIERELNTLKVGCTRGGPAHGRCHGPHTALPLRQNENNQLQKQLSEAHSQQQQLEDARLRMEERAAKLDKARVRRAGSFGRDGAGAGADVHASLHRST